MLSATMVLIYKVCAMLVGIAFAHLGFRLHLHTLSTSADVFEKSLDSKMASPQAARASLSSVDLSWRNQYRLTIANVAQSTLFAAFGAAVIICVDFLSLGVSTLTVASAGTQAAVVPATASSGGSSDTWTGTAAPRPPNEADGNSKADTVAPTTTDECESPRYWKEIAVPLGSTALLCMVTIGTALLSVRAIRHQLWLTPFLEFTARYAAIRAGLPDELKRSASALREEEWSTKQRDSVWDLFFLYWTEWKTRKFASLLDDETWNAWLDSLRDLLKNPKLRAEWEEIQKRYEQGFVNAINNVVGRAGPAGSATANAGKG